MANIHNLETFDPFADTQVGGGLEGVGQRVAQSFIHIRIQQRNGRKTLTTVQGLASDLNLKKILKYCKREMCCNGTIVKDPEMGKVIQLQGDQRQNMADFLVSEHICDREDIKIHGF